MKRSLRLLLAASALASFASLLPLGCGGGESHGSGGGGSTTTSTTTWTGTTSSTTTSSSTSTGTGGTGGTGGSSTGTGGAGGSMPGLTCPTTFTYIPSGPVQKVRVAGEWQGFDLGSAPELTPSAGVYSVKVDLPPGLWAYKIVYDDAGSNPNWVLDPGQGRRKYVGGIENSAVKVRDCSLPTFTVSQSQAARPAAGQGTYQAELAYVDGIDGGGPDPQGFVATLQHEGVETTLTSSQLTVDANGKATIAVGGLADGKYRITIAGKTKNGKLGEPLRLIFWIEPEKFDWNDAVIYMVMIDRYRDGEPANDIPSPTPGADPRGDFSGGDLQGVRQSIADGTLDKLGVRAIWLSPFGTSPGGAYLASDGVHMVTGYHGYWPIKGREVDPRWGGDTALKEMVIEAHKHGIRVLQDFVIHHVHSDHEYVAAHPDWFILNGCVCGTDNCDWTAHALDCKFTDYLPNIDHMNPAANAAFTADAVWWLDAFDLDGFRVDAVKHVPEAATRNLAAEVREEFEKAGTRYFLKGETAMGWDDCNGNDASCNAQNYGTINQYLGPHGLDGQLDFVLYHGVSYRTFAYGDRGFIHADFWVKNGLSKWAPGSIMTPYIGSQDTSRFASLADYRGQDGAHDRSIPNNQWESTAVAPGDAEPYRRTRIAMSWLLELPGAPLLYYGDEYGQWGGADPNNRLMWRNEAALTANESATLDHVRKLGQARRATPALRRGSYVSLLNTSEDTLVYGRSITPGNGAVVAFTRLGTAQTVSVDLATKMGFTAGTKLHDAMGGPDVTVTSGATSIAIPASGAVILAP